MRDRIISVLLAVSLMLSLILTGCSASSPVPDPTETVPATYTASATEYSTTATTSAPTTVPMESTMSETILPTAQTQETEPSVTETVEENDEAMLTTTQRNSINMLNYITVLTQEINASKGSRIYLESVQFSLLNNIYPNAVDSKTQSQINSLWKTIDEYRMISVKRDRLEYIYEQNKAQAMREAIPNPLGLLSTVQSGNMLKAAAAVLYMAVDAKTSYDRASTQADLKHLQEGWELEDAETNALSASQLNLLNYTINMVRDNDFPGEFGLTEEAVKDFVKWANEDNLVRKINWLEKEKTEKTYREFRTYWLELAKSYYKSDDYRSCLRAIERYEEIATRIFREDHDFAETLPMAIVSAKKVMSNAEYIEYAVKYLQIILDNCDKENWELRYFVAQAYIDLYATTDENDYLEKAYQIAYANVNELVDEQATLNAAYLADIIEEEAEEGASKREKQEIKEYNKYIKEKRKRELPPVSETFYLNCELLFALADELGISYREKKDIDATIHEGGQQIFLTDALDNRFWACTSVAEIDSNDIAIEFNGEKIVIPASCLTDRSVVTVSISDGTVVADWEVKEVKRPKNGTDCSDFMVTMTSKDGRKHKYAVGETITITIIPVSDAPDYVIEFYYTVIEKKTLGVIKGIAIERITK